MIEIGRYNQTTKDNRHCPFCGCNVIEDEVHFLFQCPTYSMIRNKFYYKVKTLIPNITELPINGLINELMNSSNYLAKKRRIFFNQKQTSVDGALGAVHQYRVIFEKLTKNPRETEFSGDKTARFRKRLPQQNFLKTLAYRLVWLNENQVFEYCAGAQPAHRPVGPGLQMFSLITLPLVRNYALLR